jgi:alkylhydroperoxidase family enzyme
MPSQRIASLASPLPPGVAAPMARLIPPDLPPPTLFTAFARNEGLFAFLVETGLIGPTGLLDRRVLPRDLRECVVLRTCVAAGNDYEFNLHVQTISDRMGLSPAQVDDVRRPHPDAALWTAQQFAAMRLADALVALDVPDALWSECRDALGEEMLVEIAQLAGMYFGVAILVALLRPAFDSYRFAEPVLAH